LIQKCVFEPNPCWQMWQELTWQWMSDTLDSDTDALPSPQSTRGTSWGPDSLQGAAVCHEYMSVNV